MMRSVGVGSNSGGNSMITSVRSLPEKPRRTGKKLCCVLSVDCVKTIFDSKLALLGFLGDRLLDIPCKVCGDRSSGKHYGIFSCDGKSMNISTNSFIRLRSTRFRFEFDLNANRKWNHPSNRILLYWQFVFKRLLFVKVVRDSSSAASIEPGSTLAKPRASWKIAAQSTRLTAINAELVASTNASQPTWTKMVMCGNLRHPLIFFSGIHFLKYSGYSVPVIQIPRASFVNELAAGVLTSWGHLAVNDPTP